MAIQKESHAVAVAQAHVEAWADQDFETARSALANDVTVTIESTSDALPPTNISGIDEYMKGLEAFAGGVVPGSLAVHASLGDERNALLLTSVEAAFGPDGTKVTLPAARLYLLDDDRKIKADRVVVYMAPSNST